jgi:hypothetical protein
MIPEINMIEMRWRLGGNSLPLVGRLEMRINAGTAQFVNAPLVTRAKRSFARPRPVLFVALSNRLLI